MGKEDGRKGLVSWKRWVAEGKGWKQLLLVKQVTLLKSPSPPGTGFPVTDNWS